MKEPLFAERFVARREDRWEDGWTYGDWRQFVCRRPDGALQCARAATWPLFAHAPAILAIVGLLTGFMLWWQGVDVAWNRLAVLTIVALAIEAPLIWMAATGRRFMVAVGPRHYEGKRVFWHELDEDPRIARKDRK